MKKSQGALENRAATALTMALSDYQVTTIIKDTENRIIELSRQHDLLKAEHDAAYEMFQKAYGEYTAVKNQLQENNILLDSMTRYKNNLGSKKAIRLVRSESHSDMKDKEKKKYSDNNVKVFKWTELAVEVLKEQNRMIEIEELFQIVEEKINFKQQLKDMGKLGKYSNIKWGAIHNCWLANCAKSKDPSSKESNRYLFEYKNHIGLYEWATGDFKPKPEYANIFKQPALAVAV